MPVKKEPSGRRSVETEVEVPGTPEEVWRAIATGPGISSWFVPTKLEEREGGKVEACFGPNMDSLSQITAWDPPRRYAADSRDDMGPNDPTIATEWTIEARSGGRCVVRVVHSWVTDSDAWDDLYEKTQYGWVSFFRLLRLYLTHFGGQHGSVVQLTASLPAPKEEAWSTLVRKLGFGPLELGQRISTHAPAPKLTAQIERVGEQPFAEELLLRLEQPAPGFAHLFAMPMGGQVILPIRLFLFGERAHEIATNQEPTWAAWFAAHLTS